MKIRSILLWACLWGPALGGCDEIAGIEDGSLRGNLWCSDVADCKVEVPECRAAVACDQGECQYQDADQGTTLQAQTAGDCAKLVCNGKGGKKLAADESDKPDDGNPCTEDSCEGTSPVHTPLAVVSCYTGPEGTAGVGICAGGIQHCDAKGNPTGGCLGEIGPGLESCDVLARDEDCDGKVNEEGQDCVCLPGSTMACYTGPEGTSGTGACHGGTATCVQNGLAYGPCMGDQTPEAETCDAAMIDEDCDGLTNEEGASCKCGDGYFSPVLGEECDDGNTDPLDSCSDLCKLTKCGDGIVQHGETCDDGNTNEGDACPGSCLRPIAHIFAAIEHGCALRVDGRLKCWGKDDYGQLGLDEPKTHGDEPDEMGDFLPAVDLGTGETAVTMGATGRYSCAVLQNGGIKCWGANFFGNLGLGDISPRGDGPGEMGDQLPIVSLGAGETAIEVAAGLWHACALLEGGRVKCWGHNDRGQLGLGDTEDRGDQPNEMGDSLPEVDLGAGNKAVAITAGWHHVCALLQDGRVKCWGDGGLGILGLGARSQNSNRGDEPDEMGDNLPVVDLGTGKKAVAITAGFFHTCALLEGGSVKCWGDNEYGELGLGDKETRGDEPNEMGDNLPAVDLGAGKTALAVAAGSDQTCALLEGGDVKCWGHNDSGQLGQGDVENRGDEVGEMGDSLPVVNLGAGKVATALTAGAHTCALLSDGRAKCWGGNAWGQLGLGDTATRGDEPKEMGDYLPAVAP